MPTTVLTLVILSLVPAMSFAEDHTGSTAGQLAAERLRRASETVSIGFDFEVKQSCLDPAREELLSRIKAGQPVLFDELTEAFIELHRSRGAAQGTDTLPAELNGFLLNLRGSVTATDLNEIKKAYEDARNQLFTGIALYNGSATTLSDICRNNRLQCYSGTSENLVITRKLLGRDAFQNNNPVVIHEPGHVLPGYLVQEGQDWHLYGIETTATGLARIDYGLTKDLRRELQIVDSQEWLLWEIFEDCLLNQSAVRASAVERTATRYGIPLEHSTPAEFAGGTSRAELTSESPLNSSIFSFGEAEIPPGDILRGEIEGTLLRSELGDSPQLVGERPPPEFESLPLDARIRELFLLMSQLSNDRVSNPGELDRLFEEAETLALEMKESPQAFNPNLRVQPSIMLEYFDGAGIFQTEPIPLVFAWPSPTVWDHPDFDPNQEMQLLGGETFTVGDLAVSRLSIPLIERYLSHPRTDPTKKRAAASKGLEALTSWRMDLEGRLSNPQNRDTDTQLLQERIHEINAAIETLTPYTAEGSER